MHSVGAAEASGRSSTGVGVVSDMVNEVSTVRERSEYVVIEDGLDLRWRGYNLVDTSGHKHYTDDRDRPPTTRR